MQTAADRYAGAIDQRLASYLVARGIDRDAATGHLLGLVEDPVVGHEAYRGMLSIPYVTPAGVVAIKFRCAEMHSCKELGHQKYLAPPGQKPRLFNVRDLFTPFPYIAICEGELDTVVMSARIGVPAVGVAGGNAWQDHYPLCFADFDRVYVVMDNDEKDVGSNPGASFAKTIIESLAKRGTNAVMIRPPAGHDVTSWYMEHGEDAVREKVLGE